MNILSYIFIFCVGLCIGSFMLCALVRWFRKESFVAGRSRCDACYKKLSWFELIPLISFIFLKGKCRYCAQHIGWYSPVVELVVGGLYVWAWQFHSTQSIPLIFFVRDIFFITILSVIFIYDALYKLIIPGIIWVGILGGFIFNYLILKPANSASVGSLGMAVIVGGGFFLLQYIVSKGRWIGVGDTYIGVMMGVWLGWPLVLVAILFSYIIGACMGVVLLLFKKRQLQSEIALGSFLTIGTLCTIYWGEYFLKLILF